MAGGGQERLGGVVVEPMPCCASGQRRLGWHVSSSLKHLACGPVHLLVREGENAEVHGGLRRGCTRGFGRGQFAVLTASFAIALSPLSAVRKVS
eukprot:9066161-Pyramimonas_sp.AAC.1